MKNFFLDINVVIDYLANRTPYSIQAAALFQLAEDKKITIFISSASYNIIYYILRRTIDHKTTIDLLNDLMSLTVTLDVTGNIVRNAIISDYNDLEDAIQYYTAQNNKKVEAIITRDRKGFKKSDLPVFTADEVVSIITS